MLPRVTAALSQFIAPIASAAQRSSVQKKESGEQSGFQRQSKRNLKLVPPEEKAAELPAQPKSGPGASVTTAFIQLLSMIQKHRGSLLRWIGPKAYRAALHEQKQAGKFRKGSMLDIKAD